MVQLKYLPQLYCSSYCFGASLCASVSLVNLNVYVCSPSRPPEGLILLLVCPFFLFPLHLPFCWGRCNLFRLLVIWTLVPILVYPAQPSVSRLAIDGAALAVLNALMLTHLPVVVSHPMTRSRVSPFQFILSMACPRVHLLHITILGYAEIFLKGFQ